MTRSCPTQVHAVLTEAMLGSQLKPHTNELVPMLVAAFVFQQWCGGRRRQRGAKTAEDQVQDGHEDVEADGKHVQQDICKEKVFVATMTHLCQIIWNN